jgi:hypothetical protein
MRQVHAAIRTARKAPRSRLTQAPRNAAIRISIIISIIISISISISISIIETSVSLTRTCNANPHRQRCNGHAAETGSVRTKSIHTMSESDNATNLPAGKGKRTMDGCQDRRAKAATGKRPNADSGPIPTANTYRI